MVDRILVFIFEENSVLESQNRRYGCDLIYLFLRICLVIMEGIDRQGQYWWVSCYRGLVVSSNLEVVGSSYVLEFFWILDI